MKRVAYFLTLVCAAAAATKREPFRSQQAPADTISNYDVILPVVVYEEGSRLYPKKLKIEISVSDETLKLSLEMNHDLISPNFKATHYDEAGQEIFTKGFENCYYHGEVEGHPDWSVTMSTCQGLQGSFGDSRDEDHYYHLEPLNYNDTSLEQLHAVYLTTEYQHQQKMNCGSDHSAIDHLHLSEGVNMTKFRARVRRQSSAYFYLELVIVNDFQQYDAHGRNLTRTVQRTLNLANIAYNLFTPLNIRIAVVDVITWTVRDQINISSDPDILIRHFRDYNPQIITTHDAAMLVTGQDLDGSTAGIAFVGALCHTSGVAVTQDGHHSVGVVFTHELGHLFGMDHDDSPKQTCRCNDTLGKCIMAAQAGPLDSSTMWSSCSRLELDNGLFGFLNLQRCLSNIPTVTVGDPVCGNGIPEEGEECDCGSPEECTVTDPCCNARTCQLADGAECGAGPCCQSNCRFRPYGTTCRAASGQCDIEENCSGVSSECPADTNLQDGTSCNSDTAYCYDGVCQTHDDQCQFHFASRKGVDGCYATYNTRGDQFGNCGHTSSAFIPCAQSDVQCGQLHCTLGNYQQTADVSVRIATVSVFIPSTRSFDRCNSFTTLPGSDEMSPGLVQDGTKCGNNRLCLSQRCVSRSNLNVPACPTGSNGLICSDNGKCNNNGQCSCDVGFTGSSCQTPVPGSVPCPDPPALANGRRTFTGNSVGDIATYTCNTGFELIGNPTTTCTAAADGNSATFPAVPPPLCSPLCPDPPALVNGKWTFTGNSVGDIVTYACNTGFELIGDPIATCTAAADGNSATFLAVPPPLCSQHLTVSISVDYSPPNDFNGSLKEYRAASGPVTVTCTATGPGTGAASCQWSSTCRNCPFRTATTCSIKRAAVHSGDTGTHTCVATRGGVTANASIDFRVVGCGMHLFKGSPRGNLLNNSIAISDNPASGFRLHIFCRSDSMSGNIGQFIGVDETAVTINNVFAVAHQQPGEVKIENIVGSHNAINASQQGVYSCVMPLQSGEIKAVYVGIYPSGFNTPPRIVILTIVIFKLTCTSTGSPATTVTWMRDGQPLTIDGNTYQMTQTVTDRVAATYDNVLTINQPVANIVGSTFTCTVTNILGSDTSNITVLCPDPPALANGKRTFTGNSVGDTATYTCNTGFELIGDPTTTCSAAAGGNSAAFPAVPPPMCSPLCPDPPTLVSGKWTFTGNSVGDIVTYACNTGFELIGDPIATCTAAADGHSATFTAVPPPMCIPLCLDPPALVNGKWTFTGNSVGDIVTYACNAGFELIGDPTATCTAAADGNSATFPAVPPPVCNPLCLDPPALVYGKWTFTGNSVGDIVTYACNTGFELIGDPIATCTAAADGHSATFPAVPPPMCSPLCPLQVDPANGTVTCTGTGRSVGDTCTYTCNDNFELIRPMTTTCTEAPDGNSAAFSPSPPPPVCRQCITCSISVDYSPPAGFTPGPNEYWAASGPVTVTCTATGPGTGTVSYQWSSTCRKCPFQSATTNSIKRAAVHSGDTGIHTCTCTRNGITASANINFLVVGSGIRLFRGSPRGKLPNNGLAISENPVRGFRLRIFCRSDSMSGNIGQLIGLNGNALTSNSFFAIARPQPGEITVENIVGSQSALPASQQGVYTCRIPLQSGEMSEINVGVYPNGFNTPPRMVTLTSQTSSLSSTLTCTSTGSPATTVTWTRNGQPLTIDGSSYQMTQTVSNRAASTYESVLTINQPLANIADNTFTCTVENSLGTSATASVAV